MIKKELIGAEDINFGADTFNRTGKSGTNISISRLNRGFIPSGILSKSSNYNILKNDDSIYADTSGGAFTLTLPIDSSFDNKVYTIIMTGIGVNILTVEGIINGLSNLSVQNQYTILTVLKNGTSYLILNSEGLVW